MMLPCLTIALMALAMGGAYLLLGGSAPRHARAIALFSVSLAFVSVLASVVPVMRSGQSEMVDALLPWLAIDAIIGLPLACFLGLLLLIVWMAPQEDTHGPSLAGKLLIGAGTTLAFSAVEPLLLAAGWWITSLPMFRWKPVPDCTAHWLKWTLIAANVAMTGLVMMPSLAPDSSTGLAVFSATLFGLAVALRHGLFPAHGGYLAAFDNGPLGPVKLLFNGQLAALLIVRADEFLPHTTLHQGLNVLCIIACLASLLTGLRAFTERKPRRVIALVLLSVSSSVLAGLASMEATGIAGALLIWLMVVVASSGLVAVMRSLEARTDQAIDPRDHLGLGARAPRLAFFFLLFGLALIGLPGTLGFVGEDLLFNGALHHYPILGIALPLATALNAIHLLRTYHVLFNGLQPKDVAAIPDALPRERWAMFACLAFLIVLGLIPTLATSWSGPAAERIMAGYVTAPPTDLTILKEPSPCP